MIRTAIIGAGDIAQKHLAALNEINDVVITVVIDTNQASASALAPRLGARSFRTVQEALPLFDAAYVLTPPRARVQIIKTLAEAGKAIFCEKPIAATLKDAVEITSIVDRTGSLFMVGFMRRWHPAYVAIKRAIDEGDIGTPIQFFRQRIGYLPMSKDNWRVDAAQLCGLTVESASHDIDLLRWLGGEILSATGVVHESDPDLPGYDDTMAASIRFVSNATGVLQVSWASRLQYNQLGVFGTRGADIISGAGMWASDFHSSSRAGEADPVCVAIDAATANDDGYGGENRTFLALIRGEDVPYPGVYDGLRTVEISHDVLASSR